MKIPKKYRKVLLAVLMMFLLDAVVWFLVFSRGAGEGELALYFLDVGQGDSQLVILPSGVKVLIDGGQPNSRVTRELGEVFESGDSYIDLIVMTHPQNDHFGGLIDVLKNFEVGAFLGTGRKGEINAYYDLIRVIKEKNIPYITLLEGDKIKNGNSEFLVLSPNQRNLFSGELNDTSLVLMLTHENLKALYTGDIGFSVEDYIREKYDIRAQVLKVGHHGSRFSSSAEFLEEVSAGIAAIGVGKNSYGHPTKDALNGLESVGARVLRTDLNGTIKLLFNGQNMRIFNEK